MMNFISIFHADNSESFNANSISIKMIENTSTPIQYLHPQSGRTQRRHLAILLLIFLVSIVGLCTMYILFPKIDPYVLVTSCCPSNISLFFFFSEDQEAFHIPKTIDDAKILGNILYKYSKHHRYIIMTAFFLTYIL